MLKHEIVEGSYTKLNSSVGNKIETPFTGTSGKLQTLRFSGTQ